MNFKVILFHTHAAKYTPYNHDKMIDYHKLILFHAHAHNYTNLNPTLKLNTVLHTCYMLN